MCSTPAAAQVIHQDSDLAYVLRQTHAHLDIFGSATYLSNATGAPNLSPALGGQADSDVVLTAGVDAGIDHKLADRVIAFGEASLSTERFTRHAFLSYNNLDAAVGLTFVPGARTRLQVVGSCHSERDDHFTAFYSYCGPSAVATVRPLVIGRHDPVTVDLVARYAYAAGARDTFARYQLAEARLVVARSSARWRIEGGPQVSYRSFGNPLDTAFTTHRADWSLSVPISLQRRFGERLWIGVTAAGVANWSNYDTFRYWTFMVGPSFKYRFSM